MTDEDPFSTPEVALLMGRMRAEMDQRRASIISEFKAQPIDQAAKEHADLLELFTLTTFLFGESLRVIKTVRDHVPAEQAVAFSACMAVVQRRMTEIDPSLADA